MIAAVVTGVAAGAIGTVALNITTYLDMLVRARSSSGMPAKTAGTIAEKAGVALKSADEPDSAAQHRKSALGALSGYTTGLAVGALYGLVRQRAPSVPWPLTGLGVGAAAMAGSDLPATLLGVTDPRKWGASGWLSDIVPHAAYGMLTVLAYERFEPEPTRGPLTFKSCLRATVGR